MGEASFIDEINIKIKAGNGGNGISSFHREKYVSRGGPAGGNGGNGGDIYFKAEGNLNTLLSFRGKRSFKAEIGGNGGPNNRTGASGKNLIIPVPIGTEIIINDKKVADLFFENQIYLVQTGGKGGRGNASFKSSKNSTPTLHENGEVTEWIEVKLNLKILADIGLLGYPNAGKSTFLSIVSNAKPKIANYPFTTLVPNLGMINFMQYSYIITDLPGLIEGASENKGMGFEFLKHLSRTKIIAHLIDASENDIVERYNTLRSELEKYSLKLFEKREIIVITKIDMIEENRIKEIQNLFKNQKVFFISAITKIGVNELLIQLGEEVKTEREREEIELKEKLEKEDFVFINFESLEKKDHNDDEYFIKNEDNVWELSGPFPYYWAHRIPLDTHENFLRIWAKFKSRGIIDELREKGIKENDIIEIKGTKIAFEFKESAF